MTDHPLRATLLVNMAARGVAGRFDPSRATRYLRKRGVEADYVVPASAAEATRAARDSAMRGDDLLFVAGGDGSLRDAADGIAGSSTALAPIPAGTANVFAKELGLPIGARAAIDAHLGGQRLRMDLGRAGQAPFLLMASVGWDAAITRTVSHALKRRIGKGAYALEALRRFPTFRARLAEWEVHDHLQEDRLGLLVVSNTRLYGGMVEFTPGALADDGLLDVVALCPRRPGDGVRLSARLLTHRLANDRAAHVGRAPEVHVATPGLPVQLDGDYVFDTPVTFTVEPRALLLSLPSGSLPKIFEGSGARRTGEAASPLRQAPPAE